MKIGICGNMVVQNLRNGGIEAAPVLAGLGYDYIELSLSHITELDTKAFSDVMKLVSDSGIPCESCNNFFPPHLKLTGPEANLPEILIYAEKALKCATDLGASIVVFGSGPAKNVPPGFSKDEAWKQLVQLCRELDLIAGRQKITIALEPLRKEECNIINTVKEAIRLMKDADTENVKVLVDYYHLDAEKESPDILIEAKPDLCHIHFANPAGRIFPKSWDENSVYSKFFENLGEIDYNGRISIEAFSNNFYEDAKASIDFMNQIKNSWN